MSRELLFMRHGKAEHSLGGEDHARPITDRGKRAAQRMGVWLRQQDLLPDRIISSSAVRALATAEKLCKAMGSTAQHILQDERIYTADRNDLIEVLRACPTQVERLLLVGHNPSLQQLLRYLAIEKAKKPTAETLLNPATLAKLTFQCEWKELSQECAQLVSITHAGALPKGFPYSTLTGTEVRKRPAYYYSQSSVIPYRLTGSGLSILLISSSKQHHKVVPKGIIEPGLTAQDSAAKEAWEEAGVMGQVGDQLLGSYHYEKWGGECSVQVFPMLVTEIIPERQWQESHRGREWFAPEKAQKLVKQRELAPLIEKLARVVLCEGIQS